MTSAGCSCKARLSASSRFRAPRGHVPVVCLNAVRASLKWFLAKSAQMALLARLVAAFSIPNSTSFYEVCAQDPYDPFPPPACGLRQFREPVAGMIARTAAAVALAFWRDRRVRSRAMAARYRRAWELQALGRDLARFRADMPHCRDGRSHEMSGASSDCMQATFSCEYYAPAPWTLMTGRSSPKATSAAGKASSYTRMVSSYRCRRKFGAKCGTPSAA